MLLQDSPFLEISGGIFRRGGGDNVRVQVVVTGVDVVSVLVVEL